jgi:hypothetical protein
VQGAGYTGTSERSDNGGSASVNTWHVLTVKVTPTAVETFVDGVSAGATSSSGQTSGRTALALGSRWWDSLEQQFVGYLREVRVYSAAHDQAAVDAVVEEMADVPAEPGPAVVSTASIYAWFKADAITGVTSGNDITEWLDSSPSALDLTPGANAPAWVDNVLNGEPVVRFNGSSDTLSAAMSARSQPFTFFVVAEQASSTGTQIMLHSTSGASCPFYLTSNGKANLFSGAALATAGTTTMTDPHVIECVFNGASSVVAIDGTETTGTTGSGAIGIGSGIRVGANQGATAEFFNGDIAEIVCYAGAMDSTDRSAVRAALGAKYGITVS